MLTLPIEAAPGARPEATGADRRPKRERLVRDRARSCAWPGHAAGASNEFADVMDLFDMAAVDIVVFGGMVPPDTKELLREQIAGRNPAMTFVQGFAGIAGLIVAQVQAALTGDASAETGLAVTYDPRTRTVDLHLDRPEEVQVVAGGARPSPRPSLAAPPRCCVDAGLPAGKHTVTLPGEVPRAGVIRHRGRRGRGAGAHRRPHARRDDHGILPATSGRALSRGQSTGPR